MPKNVNGEVLAAGGVFKLKTLPDPSESWGAQLEVELLI
jgi:hypothetical protein